MRQLRTLSKVKWFVQGQGHSVLWHSVINSTTATSTNGIINNHSDTIMNESNKNSSSNTTSNSTNGVTNN